MPKSPKSSIKIRIKRIFPFTKRGFAFFLLSVLITALGYVRMDLASLLWGCAFFLIALYSFIGNHILKYILSRFLIGTPESVNINLSSGGIFPGETVNLRLRVELSGIILPGFVVGFLCKMNFSGRVPLIFNTELKKGINETFITRIGEYRGVYRSRSVSIVCSDFLKFTESNIILNFQESVTVYPSLSGRRGIPDYTETGGESSKYSAHKKRSDELLEVRKYFPGDDVRKLNWKVFAHTGELFLRVGEETPPPQSELLFILDSGLNQDIPNELRADYLDSIVEECGLNILEFISTGSEVLFLFHGAEKAMAISLEKSEELLKILSGVTWHNKPEKIVFPARKKMRTVIFSSPGSPVLEYYVKSILRKGWTLNIYFKMLEFNELRKMRIKDLIFRTEGEEKIKKKSGYNPKEAERVFKEALTAEMNRYGRLNNNGGVFTMHVKGSYREGKADAYKI